MSLQHTALFGGRYTNDVFNILCNFTRLLAIEYVYKLVCNMDFHSVVFYIPVYGRVEEKNTAA